MSELVNELSHKFDVKIKLDLKEKSKSKHKPPQNRNITQHNLILGLNSKKRFQ